MDSIQRQEHTVNRQFANGKRQRENGHYVIEKADCFSLTQDDISSVNKNGSKILF